MLNKASNFDHKYDIYFSPTQYYYNLVTYTDSVVTCVDTHSNPQFVTVFLDEFEGACSEFNPRNESKSIPSQTDC